MIPIDEIIHDAIRKGSFDNLPGAGKPLNLDDDPNTPNDKRLAYKVLRDNNYAPDWIMESKDLDALREMLLARIERGARDQQALRDAIISYNRRALSYNLKAPRGAQHKPLFDVNKTFNAP